MHKVALFLSHKPGKEIADFFVSRQEFEEITAVYLTDSTEEINRAIIEIFKESSTKIFVGKDVIHSHEHVKWFKDQKIDALISVYWPWLFQESIFQSVRLTVNFHPSLLPMNRGWYPHVYNIINESIPGVTLHEIAAGADTGNIWFQKQIQLRDTDTAKELYDRLQFEIVKLFIENWHLIVLNKVDKIIQNENLSSYNSKAGVSDLDFIDLNKKYSGRELLNNLRARSFGNKAFSYIEINGNKTYIKISLSETPNFD